MLLTSQVTTMTILRFLEGLYPSIILDNDIIIELYLYFGAAILGFLDDYIAPGLNQVLLIFLGCFVHQVYHYCLNCDSFDSLITLIFFEAKLLASI